MIRATYVLRAVTVAALFASIVLLVSGILNSNGLAIMIGALLMGLNIGLLFVQGMILSDIREHREFIRRVEKLSKK